MRLAKTRTSVLMFLLAFLLALTACSSNEASEQAPKPERLELPQKSALETSLKEEGWKVKDADQESVHLFDTDASYNILLAENQDSNLLYIAMFSEAAQAKQAYDSICSQRSEKMESAAGDYEQAVIPLDDQEGSWIFRLYDKDVVGCWFTGEEAKEKEMESFLDSLQSASTSKQSSEKSDQSDSDQNTEDTESQDESDQSDEPNSASEQDNLLYDQEEEDIEESEEGF